MAKQYNIARTDGSCHACKRKFEPGDDLVATVRDGEEELQRLDYCLPCWESSDQPDQPEQRLLGVWRTRLPQPREKKKLFVDDEVLVSFFQRLEDAEEDSRVAFRFVIALVLMRKKKLAYESSKTDDQGRDRWTMRLRGTDKTYEVIDPHLDEQRIAEVSDQLGQILEAEL
jgi:hypothetical protein